MSDKALREANLRLDKNITELPGEVARCPVCGGNGLVPPGFYTQMGGIWASSSATPERCRSCQGKGYVPTSELAHEKALREALQAGRSTKAGDAFINTDELRHAYNAGVQTACDRIEWKLDYLLNHSYNMGPDKKWREELEKWKERIKEERK